MSTINKICLFAGVLHHPSNWKICDGNNGTPKLDPIKLGNDPYSSSIPYLCCVSDDNYAKEPFLTQILRFTGDFAPEGWAFCDGAILDIRQYTALYSLLGTQFSGDGRNTFGLPKIADISNPSIRYIICLEGRFPS